MDRLRTLPRGETRLRLLPFTLPPSPTRNRPKFILASARSNAAEARAAAANSPSSPFTAVSLTSSHNDSHTLKRPLSG